MRVMVEEYGDMLVTTAPVYVGEQEFATGTDILLIYTAAEKEGLSKIVAYTVQKYDVESNVLLPTDSEERKDIPMARGLLDYFPAALAEIARLSKCGNDKHNPGEELHHAREKSSDHADSLLRHLMERGTPDPSGFSHTVMVAWRGLALLQEELEEAGAPLARAARLPGADPGV